MKGETDDRLGVLEDLALVKGDRKPYGERARSELAEAAETQQRIDAMGEGPPEDGAAEDASEVDSDERDRMMGEIRRLRTKVGELTSANIDLNAKLVAAGGEMMKLKEQLARLAADHPEIVEQEDADST